MPHKIGGVFNMDINCLTCSQVFKNCIFQGKDEADFLSMWGYTMLADFNLKENRWLMEIFDIKEK